MDESGPVVRLRDVARIELGSQSYMGYGEFNNNPGVLIAIYKMADANSLEVAASVKAKMEELSQFFPEGVDYTIGHATTEFIDTSVHETVLTMVGTIVLVVLVTCLFPGSVRATLIPTIAVPVSIIGTLTLSPALASVIMRHETGQNVVIRGFNWAFDHVTRWYIALVEFLCRHLVISAVAFLQQKYQAMFSKIPEAQTLVFGTPAIPGLGAIAGTSYVLQDTQGAARRSLNNVIQEALEGPEIMRSFSTFRPYTRAS